MSLWRLARTGLALAGVLLLSAWASVRLPTREMPGDWIDLSGPAGGPAQVIALSPDFARDQIILAGGGIDMGMGSWQGRGLFRTGNASLTWSNPTGLDRGALFDVAFSADFAGDGHAVAALWQGVWKTTDWGATWRAISSPTSAGVGPFTSIAISPDFSDDHTYLATDANGFTLRSTDAGDTWDVVGGMEEARKVTFSQLTADAALLAAGNGLYHSVDGGASWQLTDVISATYDVSYQQGPDLAFAVTAERVWRSEDRGLSWQAMPAVRSAVLAQGGDLRHLAISADGHGLFVASTGSLYRFEAQAGVWQQLIGEMPDGGRIVSLAVSPQFHQGRRVFVGTVNGVWESTDGGQAFQRAPGFYQLDVHALGSGGAASSMPPIYAATDLGVWRHDGDSWWPANAGLWQETEGRIHHISIAADDPANLFAVRSPFTGFGAAIYRSTDGGTTWRQQFQAGKISQVHVSPGFTEDGRVYTVSDQRILVSMDGGETWAVQDYWGIPPDAPHTAAVLVLSPAFAQDGRMIAAGSSVYHSTNGGETWMEASQGPPLQGSPSWGWVVNRVVAANPDTYYLSIHRYDTTPPYSRHDQLWRSADGGDTWQQLVTFPNVPVMAMAAEEQGTFSRLFIATGPDRLYEPDAPPSQLWASYDRGGSWQNLGSVPDEADQHSLWLERRDSAGQLLVGASGVWRLLPDSAPTVTPAPCRDLIRNGSFEEDTTFWRIPPTAATAYRTMTKSYQGNWSMFSGIDGSEETRRSFSDFSQDLTLPDSAQLKLTFYRWPQSVHGDTPISRTQADTAFRSLDSAQTLSEFYRLAGTLESDLHYGMVIVDGRIHYLYRDLVDAQGWRQEVFDLEPFAGQTVRLQFGTLNTTDGVVSSQYFDLFSLGACAHTPVPTETAELSPAIWLPLISH